MSATQRYLNWRDHKLGSVARAARAVGVEYRIARESPHSNAIRPTFTELDRFVAAYNGRHDNGSPKHRHLGTWPTLEAAKAAAEADHVERKKAQHDARRGEVARS